MRHSFKSTLYQRLARCLITLYPASWRERYADEMLLILEEVPPTLITLFNLVISLIDASLHCNIVQERNPHMLQKIRTNELVIYGATIIFFLSWSITMTHTIAYKMYVFNTMHYQPSLLLMHLMTSIFYLLLAFILLGGLPILLAACWKALRTRNFRGLLLCILGLISPFVSTFLIILFYILFDRITGISSSFGSLSISVFIGIDISLALIFFAIQHVAPSRIITHASLYLAALLPLVMLISLIAISLWILPYIIAAFTLGGATTYLLKQGLLLFIMIVAFSFCLVSLLNSFQARWGAQNLQERSMEDPIIMQ